MASTTKAKHEIRHTLGPDQARETALSALKHYSDKYPNWRFEVAGRDMNNVDVVMRTPIHIEVKMCVHFGQGLTVIEAEVPFLASIFIRPALLKISEAAAEWIEKSGGQVLPAPS